MFNNRLSDKVDLLEGIIERLEIDLWDLKNPPKYKIGSKVSYRQETKCGTFMGEGQVVGCQINTPKNLWTIVTGRVWPPYRTYDVFDGERINCVEEQFITGVIKPKRTY